MPSLLIETANPLDLPPTALADLAAELREIVPGGTVEVVGREVRRGALGVTWYEVIMVWGPTAITYGGVVLALLKWARAGARRSPGRPRHVTVYDTSGKLIGAFLIRDPTRNRRIRRPRSKRNGGRHALLMTSPQAVLRDAMIRAAMMARSPTGRA